mmetsp:Transcript_21758/g.70281  ORF Transcript_21758/g.70281 Transcript_21758/m.70281 type:complete len:209 (-) Transcript_21758:566-1192(-)
MYPQVPQLASQRAHALHMADAGAVAPARSAAGTLAAIDAAQPTARQANAPALPCRGSTATHQHCGERYDVLNVPACPSRERAALTHIGAGLHACVRICHWERDPRRPQRPVSVTGAAGSACTWQRLGRLNWLRCHLVAEPLSDPRQPETRSPTRSECVLHTGFGRHTRRFWSRPPGVRPLVGQMGCPVHANRYHRRRVVTAKCIPAHR